MYYDIKNRLRSDSVISVEEISILNELYKLLMKELSNNFIIYPIDYINKKIYVYFTKNNRDYCVHFTLQDDYNDNISYIIFDELSNICASGSYLSYKRISNYLEKFYNQI
jgi:hypothetical protein